MTGSGTALDPWVIWDLADLQAVGNGAPYLLTDYYELGRDIDATPTRTWNWNAGRGVFEGFAPTAPVYLSPFQGSFDGNYHTISGLYMDRIAFGGGLFAHIAVGATVQNLYMENVDITLFYEAPAQMLYVGALVGHMRGGVVQRVQTSGSVHGTLRDTLLPGANYCAVGGLVGYHYNDGTIRYCCSYADVTAVGMMHAISMAGGLVGLFFDESLATSPLIHDCYARGAATHVDDLSAGGAGGLVAFLIYHEGWPTIDNCYSTGLVAGPAVGGLIASCSGLGPGYSVTDCFWDTQTSGTAISAAGTGRTTVQMQTRVTFTGAGWDFVAIWDIDDIYVFHNDGYPYFLWAALPTITVVSPNGGEVWYAGDTHWIRWNYTGDLGGTNVLIELLLAGVLDEVIIASTAIGSPEVGGYSWTINAGKADGEQYRVRITCIEYGPATDTSDDDFIIKTRIVPFPSPAVATLPATGVG